MISELISISIDELISFNFFTFDFMIVLIAFESIVMSHAAFANAARMMEVDITSRESGDTDGNEVRGENEVTCERGAPDGETPCEVSAVEERVSADPRDTVWDEERPRKHTRDERGAPNPHERRRIREFDELEHSMNPSSSIDTRCVRRRRGSTPASALHAKNACGAICIGCSKLKCSRLLHSPRSESIAMTSPL